MVRDVPNHRNLLWSKFFVHIEDHNYNSPRLFVFTPLLKIILLQIFEGYSVLYLFFDHMAIQQCKENRLPHMVLGDATTAVGAYALVDVIYRSLAPESRVIKYSRCVCPEDGLIIGKSV